MRDDIHNKAPISAALRAVLRQALRPADQQRPDRLSDLAIKALAKELAANLPMDLLDMVRLDGRQPDLFGPASFATPHCSRVHADLVDHLTEKHGATLDEACQAAARSHVDSLCNESEAALLAAGGDRAQVRTGVNAFRAALQSAIPTAAKACIERTSPEVPDHRVTLSEKLPLGKRAQGRAQ